MWFIGVNISANCTSMWFFPLGCYIRQSRVGKVKIRVTNINIISTLTWKLHGSSVDNNYVQFMTVFPLPGNPKYLTFVQGRKLIYWWWTSRFRILGIDDWLETHFSKGTGAFKQNGAHEKKSFPEPTFHGLSCGVIRLVAIVSSKNHLLAAEILWHPITIFPSFYSIQTF